MSDEPKHITGKQVVVAGVVGLALFFGYMAFANRDQPRSMGLAEAFCADLDNGLTPMNLWPRDQDPEEFAKDAWGYVSTTCPEHYRTFSAYFDSWGLPPIDG